jgi:uncharacterized protein
LLLIAAPPAGLVFVLGSAPSGVVDPARVLGLLVLAGCWNPALLPAIAVGLVVFFGAEMKLPPARHIDRRLVAGSLLSGIGVFDLAERPMQTAVARTA